MKNLMTFVAALGFVAVTAASASAVSATDVTVQCRGDKYPKGVPITMIDRDGLIALKEICDAQGGVGTFEAQMSVGVDQRVAPSGLKISRSRQMSPAVSATGDVSVEAVTEWTEVPFREACTGDCLTATIAAVNAARAISGLLPMSEEEVETFIATQPATQMAEFRVVVDGTELEYADLIENGNLVAGASGVIQLDCEVVWTDLTADPELSCSGTLTAVKGGGSYEVENSYIYSCPTSYSYDISVAGQAVSDHSAGGGACSWKQF